MDKEEFRKHIKLILVMSTDCLMDELTYETYIANLELILKQMKAKSPTEKQILLRQAKHEILHGGSIVFPDELKPTKNPTEAPGIRENRNNGHR